MRRFIRDLKDRLGYIWICIDPVSGIRTFFGMFIDPQYAATSWMSLAAIMLSLLSMCISAMR